MVDRQYLTIYGATGFSAKIILTELLRSRPNRWPPGFKWSIAGRNRTALQKLHTWFQQGNGNNTPSIPLPDIIVADVRDQETLIQMARQTRLLLNCVGPYCDYGEPVVKACIEAHTDYLDLCGEPGFIEKMHLIYHDLATQSGVTICHAAVYFYLAFDSVPCDLGVALCKKILAERGAYPSSVEMLVTVNTAGKFAINYATYESAVKGFSSTRALAEGRKELGRVRPKPVPVGPPLNIKMGAVGSGILGRIGVSRNTRTGGWLIPYFFSDPAVVRLSQSLTLHMTKSSGAPPAELAPVHFAAHIEVPTFRGLMLFVTYFLVFQFLVVREWGRTLLYNFPSLFTSGIVRKLGNIFEEELDGTTFTQTFYARGYSSSLHPTPANVPDVDLVIRISGPDHYKTTAIVFLEVASLLLRRRGAIKKGVLTPAVAFGDLDHTSQNVVSGNEGVLDALQKDGRVAWSIISS